MQQRPPKKLSDTLLMLFEIYDPAALGEQDSYVAEAAVVLGHRGRVSSVEETRALLCEVLCHFFGGEENLAFGCGSKEMAQMAEDLWFVLGYGV